MKRPTALSLFAGAAFFLGAMEARAEPCPKSMTPAEFERNETPPRGGHTKLCHTRKDQKKLIQRLRGDNNLCPPGTAASMFSSERAASSAINFALKKNDVQQQLAQWWRDGDPQNDKFELNIEGDKGNLVVTRANPNRRNDFPCTEVEGNLGRGYSCRTSTWFRIVMTWKTVEAGERTYNKCYVLTAYPILPPS